MLNGLAEGDNIVPFSKDGVSNVAAGVANDPWDDVPRLEVTFFNGQQITRDTPLPPNVKDHRQGIVMINQGECVIFHLQFRVGDGNYISKDWEAFRLLETLRIPYAIWAGTTSPSVLATTLPLAHKRPPSSDARGRTPCVRFDQDAVSRQYADFIERGEDAYLRSHYGDERADLALRSAVVREMLVKTVLETTVEMGGADAVADNFREMGMQDIADDILARARGSS
ncbi:hypothetical protein C8Q76DRAFT_860519 [Earliella scabrosa]|nr:hypothetical protein C8Q76DRAFT_860519 [Earliella scabrosa]